MASLTSEPTPQPHIQHERFTTKQHGYRLLDMSLSLSGSIAVSGCHNNGRTFIDQYCGMNSGSRDKLRLFYSKEFKKYSDYWLRYVSFLETDCSKIVTCIGDKIEIIDPKNESKVLKSAKVSGETTCLAVRDEEIFVGLMRSKKVIVLNDELKETKKIALKGIKDGDWLSDLQLTKDTVFTVTVQSRVLSLGESGGKLQTEYKDTTGKYEYAHSITVNEELGLVAVLWGENSLLALKGSARVIVYPLNENRSILVVDVDSDVSRIRISDRDRKMVTGSTQTGEIQMHDLAQLFTFDNMKECLASSLKREDCMKLVRIFTVSKDKTDSIIRSETPSTTLLLALEDERFIQPSNVERLSDALVKISLSCYNVVEIYKNTRPYYKAKSTYREFREELRTKEGAWKDERQQLIYKVEEIETKMKGLQVELDRVSAERTQYAQKIAELTTELGDFKLAQRIELDPTKAGFGSFQYHLSSYLTREIIKNLTLVFDLSPTEAEEVEHDKVKFVRHLKGKGVISCADITPLLRALREINQHGVADKVETLFQRNHTE